MFVFCNSKSFFFLVTFLAKTQLLRHLHWVRVTCSLQCVFNELPRCSSDAILWAVWLNTRRAGQATIWARRRQARQGLEVAKRTSRSQEVNNAQISKETTTLTTPTARRDPKTKKKKRIRGPGICMYVWICMHEWRRQCEGQTTSGPATTGMAKMRGKCVNDTEQFTIIAGRVAGRQPNAVQPCTHFQMP